MFWVYILESLKNNKLYIGISSRPERRLIQHNLGRQRWTKSYRPWRILKKIKIGNKTEALKKERKLKSFKNPVYLRRLISEEKI